MAHASAWMHQAAAEETMPLHINVVYVSWSGMLRISRTCAPSRAAALGRGMKSVDVEAVAAQDAEEQDGEVAVELALAAASGAAELDHTRGRVIMLAILAVMIIAMTHYIHCLIPTTCM